jgi:fructose-1-phosphate kinase PfkB-like protein
MNWHLEQWRAKIKESEEFAVAETERVERETIAEAARVAATKAAGIQQLLISLGMFGAFFSLALLLIFAKIESNLRGVQVIERAPQDA